MFKKLMLISFGYSIARLGVGLATPGIISAGNDVIPALEEDFLQNGPSRRGAAQHFERYAARLNEKAQGHALPRRLCSQVVQAELKMTARLFRGDLLKWRKKAPRNTKVVFMANDAAKSRQA